MKSMRDSSADIGDLNEWPGHKVRMARCIAEEPIPPADVLELEKWCESGKSGRPIQTHIGDCGIVQYIVNEEVLSVCFEDGNERLLYVDEVHLLLLDSCD